MGVSKSRRWRDSLVMPQRQLREEQEVSVECRFIIYLFGG